MTECRNPPSTATAARGVPVLVENLFRHAHGHLVSRLTRHMGPARLEGAEDAVQHAMIQALRARRPGDRPGVPDVRDDYRATHHAG